MLIRTVFTRVARFIRLIVASVVTLFSPVKLKPSGDIETGMLAHHSDGMADEEIESPILSEVIDIRRQSDPTPKVDDPDLPESRPSRRASVHPVKSRILDATLKNVRDRRLSALFMRRIHFYALILGVKASSNQ